MKGTDTNSVYELLNHLKQNTLNYKQQEVRKQFLSSSVSTQMEDDIEKVTGGEQEF